VGTVNEQLDCCLGFLCGLSFVLMVLNQHVYSHIRGFCDVCFLLTVLKHHVFSPVINNIIYHTYTVADAEYIHI
jgi:hypothetical protein